VVAGLVPRPDTEEYLECLFFGDLRQASNVVLKHVDADPGLAPVLLRLFEREGASDTSFAAVEKYCHDPALHWSTAFLTLCQRGVYTRAQLLDKTLAALSCDWPQFKSGWFSRFHGSLAPSVEEMEVYAPRYLALCHSRIAPTVTMAVEAVALLFRAGVVDQVPLLDALQPVLSSSTKAHVVAALELLGQVVKASPAAANRASGIAVHALAHSGADVQKKTLACLKLWGMDADAKEAAQAYLPLVAAVNQATLRTLLGTPVVQPAERPPAQLVVAGAVDMAVRAPVSAVDTSRVIAPIASLADLVECIAFVFENPVQLQAWECAAEALVRMAPLPATEQAAFAALQKRAKRFQWNDKPLAFALAQLMRCALGEGPDASFLDDASRGMTSTSNFVAWRARSLLALAQRGSGLPPLSAPTHQGGVVDPQQLQQRLALYAQAGLLPDAQDYALALLRQPVLEGVKGSTPALHWSVSSSEGPYVFHSLDIHADLAVSEGDGVELGGLLTTKLLTHGRWQSEREAANIRFMASLRPDDLEAFYAEGAHAVGNNLDWWEANWQNRAYLDVVLESTAVLSPMGRLLVAVGLAGKEPGQTALAVDALVQCLQQGRVTSQEMGDVLAALWATPLIKGPRIAKSLAAVAAADLALASMVYSMLGTMLAANTTVPRKDCAPLLELMLELQLARGLTLPSETRQRLERMEFTAKARAACKLLLK
jgi:Family of unknown function (DUF6493)